MKIRPSRSLSPTGGQRQQAVVWWRGRSLRDRQALSILAAVIALFLVWSFLVQPAWRSVAEAPAHLDRLDLQIQQMQRTAAESQGLRSIAPVSAAQAALALKAATDRLGEHGKLALRGDRATLTLTNADPQALRAWLSEARSGGRSRPVELQLQRTPAGYNGSLVVSVGAAP